MLYVFAIKLLLRIKFFKQHLVICEKSIYAAYFRLSIRRAARRRRRRRRPCSQQRRIERESQGNKCVRGRRKKGVYSICAALSNQPEKLMRRCALDQSQI